MSTSSQSFISGRIFAALRSEFVAESAGVLGATWNSVAIPRVFRGFTGYIKGRNRGRLPFLEFEVETQAFALDTLEGGTQSSSVRIRAHCGGADPEVASDLLAAILGAGLAAVRTEAVDNYTALGDDQISAVSPGPWGHMREAVSTFQHSYGRSDYGVT